MSRSLLHPWRVLLLAVVAAALNTVPLELPGGARFLLGPYVYMPLVLVVGGPWGVLAAAAAMVVTIPLLGHPFTFLLCVAQALWLVVAKRRWPRGALVHDLLFWLVMAPTVIPWLYMDIARQPAELTLIVIIKIVLNQFSAVAVAIFFLRQTNLAGWLAGRQIPQRRMRDIVLHSIFVLSLVPLALVSIGISMLLRAYSDREDREMLSETARQLSHQLDVFFALHESAVKGLAATLSRGGADAGPLLEEVHRAHPAFITMLVADANGRITHAAMSGTRQHLTGMNVADRDYFRQARDTRAAFVSGVFRGRGFGRDIIVAISAPIFDASGAFAGVVEASLEVHGFAQRVVARRRGEEVELLFADRFGRVIFADRATEIPPLTLLAHTPQRELLVTEKQQKLQFDRISSGGRRERLVAFASRAQRSGVMVVAQRSLLGGYQGAGAIYVLFGGMAVGIGGMAVWVGHRVRKQASEPLEYFAASADRQTAQREVHAIADQFSSAPYEVGIVFSAFNRLAEELQGTLKMLRQSNDDLDRRVTERTAEAEAARRQAEAASQSKTEFIAMTGHEIRNPLNAMIGLAEVLAENTRDPQSRERLLTIRNSGQRLLQVVNDLLDLSQAEAGKIELRRTPVELGALCEEVRALFALRAQQQGLRLAVKCDVPLPCWLETDGPRLQQVLINLVGNALKFTPQGEIILRIEGGRRTPDAIALRFGVADTGPGISAEEQARLFQPYVQLTGANRSTVPGSGLGLSISRRLVELFGSALKVRSEVGKGSEFHFTVVLLRTTAPAVAVTPQLAAPPQPPCRILVVDDNLANQEVLRSMLESASNEIVTVDSAEAALAQFAAAQFDVAFVDLEMPGADGYSVAEAVRANPIYRDAARCRLIASSAHSRRQIWPRCAASGFDDFMEKPIDRSELRRILEAATLAGVEC